MPLEIDHVIPVSRGGKTILSNLCLACRTCNGCKWKITTSHDPLTNRVVKLFIPIVTSGRSISSGANGIHLIGLTATGRATIEALQMNNQLIVNLRSLWVVLGLHPIE
jgi:hypothetical protein